MATDQASATRQPTMVQGSSSVSMRHDPQEGLAGPTLRVLDSVRKGPRIGISGLPGHADAAGPGTTLHNPRHPGSRQGWGVRFEFESQPHQAMEAWASYFTAHL